jgi:hypothetical protein
MACGWSASASKPPSCYRAGPTKHQLHHRDRRSNSDEEAGQRNDPARGRNGSNSGTRKGQRRAERDISSRAGTFLSHAGHRAWRSTWLARPRWQPPLSLTGRQLIRRQPPSACRANNFERVVGARQAHARPREIRPRSRCRGQRRPLDARRSYGAVSRAQPPAANAEPRGRAERRSRQGSDEPSDPARGISWQPQQLNHPLWDTRTKGTARLLRAAPSSTD